MIREDQGVKLSRLGDDAYDAENYSLAEALYRESLTFLSKNPVVRFKLGRALREQGNDTEAKEYFSKATSQNPNLKEELFEKKQTTSNQKPGPVLNSEDTNLKDPNHHPIAEEIPYKKSIDNPAQPATPPVMANTEDALKLGDNYAERMDYEKALQQYSLYAKEHPNDPSVLSRLAAVSSRLGDERSAACYVDYLKPAPQESDKKPKIGKTVYQSAEESTKHHKPTISDAGSDRWAKKTPEAPLTSVNANQEQTTSKPKRKSKPKKEKIPWKMRFVRKQKKSDGSGRYDETENEVNRAVSLINSNLPGGNLTEATHLLHAAGEALIRESVAECCKLACQAQLAANPTTEYLLDNARRNDQNALDAFGKADFNHAVGFWNAALDAYDRAEELATARGQKDDLNTIQLLKEKINSNIKKGSVAIENRSMASFIEQGNAATTNGNQLFNSSQYSEAIEQYQEANTKFSSARIIAFEQSFDSLSEIEVSLHSIENSIQSCHYAHVDTMIQDANEEVKSDPERVEPWYLAALTYLKDLPYAPDTSSEQMVMSANEGIIQSRILQAERRMTDGKKFFENGEFHNAKEHFRSVTEYLNDLYDEAVTRQVLSETAHIQQLIKSCNHAIEQARAGLINVSDPEVSLTAPEMMVKPVAGYSPNPRASSGNYIRPPTDGQQPPDILLEEYLTADLIGEGGFGRVYKAQKKDGSWVAVKVPKELTKATGNIFLREVENWRKIDRHPNIVTVNDFNIVPFAYIEMELCESSLADLEKPVKPEEAAKYIFDVCEGLKEAHKEHIIHRDLKPQNILIKNRIARIADWGLSRTLTDSTTSKYSGMTTGYAAPEQIDNKKKDERTDIWQVGVLLYELVTGVRPFSGEHFSEIASGIVFKDPKKPSEYYQELQKLDLIILTCLQKMPEERYDSVDDLQRDLATYLNLSYTLSFEKSVTKKEMRHSAIFCGELVVLNLKINDLHKAYLYTDDLIHLVHGEEKSDIVTFRNQLEIRLKEEFEGVPEELIRRAEDIQHLIQTGRISVERKVRGHLSYGQSPEAGGE